MSPRVRLVLVVVGLAVVVAAVLASPARSYVTPEALAAFFAPLKESPALPAYLMAAFVVAGALFLSVWLVIFQTSLLYPPLAAFPLALLGALLSAVTFYGVGRIAGATLVRRIAPARVQRAVDGAGLEAIVLVRLVPLLPFTFVNLCCGAFGVRFRVFVAGTVLGMAPGVLALSVLGERVLATVRNPSLSSVVGLVVVAAGLLGAAVWVRRRAVRRIATELEVPPTSGETASASSPSSERP